MVEEFTQLQWVDMEELNSQIWPEKHTAYTAMRAWVHPIIAATNKASCEVDLSGYWVRDRHASTNLEVSWAARRITKEQVQKNLSIAYILELSRLDEGSNWWRIVKVDPKDGKTPLRTLIYPMGPWEEHSAGNSTIFGQSEAVRVQIQSNPIQFERAVTHQPGCAASLISFASPHVPRAHKRARARAAKRTKSARPPLTNDCSIERVSWQVIERHTRWLFEPKADRITTGITTTGNDGEGADRDADLLTTLTQQAQTTTSSAC